MAPAPAYIIDSRGLSFKIKKNSAPNRPKITVAAVGNFRYLRSIFGRIGGANVFDDFKTLDM